MRYDALTEQLKELIAPIVRFHQFELVEVVYSQGSGGGVLRVTMDSDRGVSIEDCAEVSREISALLDVEDVVPGKYTLEVSSPGLDRPLRNIEDFRRFGGRLARVTLNEPVDGQKVIVGRIRSVEDDTIVMEVDGTGDIPLPYGNVRKARLEVEF